MPVLGSFVGGKASSVSEGVFQTKYCPITGKPSYQVEEAGSDLVNQAVESAKEGCRVWSTMTGVERGRILRRAVDILRDRNDELAEMEVLDTGKPLSEASVVDIASGADCLEYFAGLAPSLHGETYSLGQSFAYTRREPLGVCVGIGAWNYPLQIACWKSAPALACGNSMIFKPAPWTPRTAIKLAEIYREAGLPDGVFNVLQGGAETGQLLSRHPGVAKISLTGSVETGRRVMADAASTLKKVSFELGGKSPLIIFDDADLDEAVSGAMLGNFYTQGEICSNGTRVFVHRACHHEFLAKLLERTANIRVGDPRDPETQMGPLISKSQHEKVLSYIQKGVNEGAKLLCGGSVPRVPGCEEGYFVEPTIFDACTDSMTISREEIFGPVMCVLPFEEEAEVLRRANDTEFGLAAGVFTKDIQRAHRMVAGLEAGTCWINTYNITPIEMPFGGYKASGIGRENSLAALEAYTQIKSIYVEQAGVDSPF